MSEGRTYWWAKDAAWWRRERIIALGQEFGSAGPAVVDWLSCEAKAQNDKGWVKAGFRAVAHGAFVELVTVGHIVSRAVAVGLLDDFSDADGIFTCRISGWNSDQVRVEATLRKREQRAREASEHGESDDPAAANGHSGSQKVTERRGTSAKSPTGQDRREVQTSPVGPERPDPGADDADVVRLSHLLADLICERDPKARSRVQPDGKRWLKAMRLLVADRQGDVVEVERVLRWSQADSFWQGNILSPDKLREKFVQLAAKSTNGNGASRPAADPVRQQRRERRGSALRELLASTEGGQA